MGNEMICSGIKDMDIKSGGRKMAAVNNLIFLDREKIGGLMSKYNRF